MPDACGDTVMCEEVESAIAQGRGLSLAESAHVEGCETCLEAWLDATVVAALNAKPEARIPADFAARVAARLPQRGASRRAMEGRHWGLATAVLLVAVGLVVAAVSDPAGLNTRMGMVFIAVVVSEIAGIGLWLGAWLQR
jgi:hypothetical protein